MNARIDAFAKRAYAALPDSLREEPKKLGVLGALVGVLLIAGARAAFKSSGPERAGATTLVKTGIAVASDNLVPKSHNRSTEARDRWLAEPLAASTRNVFRVRIDAFRAVEKTAEQSVVEESFWDRVEKSQAVVADQMLKREAAAAAVQQQALALRLQSTVMSNPPQAMIDNTLLNVGQTIGGFRVLKIEPMRVVIERDGVKLELTIKR